MTAGIGAFRYSSLLNGLSSKSIFAGKLRGVESSSTECLGVGGSSACCGVAVRCFLDAVGDELLGKDTKRQLKFVPSTRPGSPHRIQSNFFGGGDFMELTDEYEELVLVSLKVNEHSLGKELLPLIQILQRLYATFRTSIIIVE